MEFSKQDTGVECHFLLQGIFPTQGLNPSLLCLLHWQENSSPLEPPGKSWTGHTYAKNILTVDLKFKFICVSCIFIHWLWLTLSARFSLASSKAGTARASLKNLTGKNCSHWSTPSNHPKMERTHRLSMDEWVNRIWSILTMKYYAAVKKNAVLIHAIRMKLENIMLHESIHSQKVRYH